MRKETRPMLTLLMALCLLISSGIQADVQAETPQALKRFVVRGDALAIGASALIRDQQGQRVKTASSAEIRDRAIPYAARIVSATLYWSGLTSGSEDKQVTLTLPGRGQKAISATHGCRKVASPAHGRAYYCQADVTALFSDLSQWAGRYTLSGLESEIANKNTSESGHAAWSLLLIHDGGVGATERTIVVDDRFQLLDETADRPGHTEFLLSGFQAAAKPQARLSFFALGGDESLGVPPQDGKSALKGGCSTCWDFAQVNGHLVVDDRGWSRNLFNGSEGPGLDIDRIDISRLVREGDRTLRVTVGSGDGHVSLKPASHGHGEAFFLGYTVLSISTKTLAKRAKKALEKRSKVATGSAGILGQRVVQPQPGTLGLQSKALTSAEA